jgi:hypothetical protein
MLSKCLVLYKIPTAEPKFVVVVVVVVVVGGGGGGEGMLSLTSQRNHNSGLTTNSWVLFVVCIITF